MVGTGQADRGLEGMVQWTSQGCGIALGKEGNLSAVTSPRNLPAVPAVQSPRNLPAVQSPSNLPAISPQCRRCNLPAISLLCRLCNFPAISPLCRLFTSFPSSWTAGGTHSTTRLCTASLVTSSPELLDDAESPQLILEQNACIHRRIDVSPTLFKGSRTKFCRF